MRVPTDSPTRAHLSLVLRMLATSLALALLTVAFLATVWYVVSAVVSVFSIPSTLAGVIAFTVLAVFVYAELTAVRSVERWAGANPGSADANRELSAAATRVATQLDVPAPTVTVSNRSVPEALVVGFRPESVHLVLSRGTLEALSDDELEAVLAHELAHVANRDAMVMTAASTPVVLATGIKRKAAHAAVPTPDEYGSASAFLRDAPGKFVWRTFAGTAVAPQRLLWWPLGAAALATVAFSKPAVAVLSRGRELAADRTAATATGSPAALASALTTLEERIDETPAEDLREVASVSALSILPLDRRPTDRSSASTAAASADRSSVPRRWLSATHPPLEDRLAVLRRLERERAESTA